jgi:hypothetical protein
LFQIAKAKTQAQETLQANNTSKNCMTMQHASEGFIKAPYAVEEQV